MFLKASSKAKIILIFFLFLPAAMAEPVTSKIIDGTRVPASAFPNVTPIIVDDETICTGTLVSKDSVLTAAHCFVDENNKLAVSENQVRINFAGQVFNSSKIYIHPSYSSRSAACAESEFDAALIKFSGSDLLPAGIEPTNLGRIIPVKGQKLTLVGYGLEGSGNSGETDRQPAAGFVNYGSTNIEFVSSSYIQWTFDPNESNTASGDSGGPSFSDISGINTLVGITCGGTGKSQYGTESYNTRIDRIVDWIDAVAGTSASPSEPKYLGPAFLQATANQPFSYELIFAGSSPDSIRVEGLPAGLSLNDRIISGTPLVSGQFILSLFASNSIGSSSSQLSLSVASFNPELNIKSALLEFDDLNDDLDFLMLTGKILLPEKFRPKGKKFKMQFGRYIRNCKLDKRGGCGNFNFFQIEGKIKRGAFQKSYLLFELQLINRRLFQALASLGFPETDFATAGEIVSLPVELTINGIIYRTTINLRFRSSDLRWVLSK